MKILAKLLSLMLVAIMLFTLVGCGGSLEKKLQGEWEGSIEGINATFTFEDGKMTVEVFGMSESTDYEIKGKKLIIEDEEVEYKFEGKDTLILTIDGDELELTKK